MKKYIVYIAGYLAATLITYSQETAATDKVAAPLTLPADNVELVDTNGRAIIVTVLSIAADKQSVVIRAKDGKEMPILMSKLNAATIAKLTGNKPAPKIRPVAANQWQTEKKATQAVYAKFSNTDEDHAFKKMPAGKAAEAILENTETGNMLRQSILHLVKYNEGEMLYKNSSFKAPMDVLAELELPSPKDEVFTLRPILEKAGIKAMKQQGNTCTTYAGMYLTQYLHAVAGKKVLSRNEFLDALAKNGRATSDFLFPHELAKGLTSLHGKKPNWLQIDTRNYRLDTELAKHMLRKGRPLLVKESGGTGKMYHAMLCIGFTTKDGETTFQCIDSNGLHVDNGYRTLAGSICGASCVWFD
jgi:hypothetical protein